MDHAPWSPCGLLETATRKVVTANAIASRNRPRKYHGTSGPSAHASSVPCRRVSSAHASAAIAAPPVTEANTVKFGPTSTSERKYKQDATPAPAPIPSDSKSALCSDHPSGRGNIHRTRPNPVNQMAARQTNSITGVSGRASRRCRGLGPARVYWPAATRNPVCRCENLR